MKNKSFENYIEISISKLVKANWNYKLDDDEKKEILKNNIKRNQQLENIIVRELDSGFYEIINGNHRYDAFVELEYDVIVAFNCGKISLTHAQRIAIKTNETHFDNDPLKLAMTIKEINLEYTDEDLLQTLPYSDEEFHNYVNGILDNIECSSSIINQIEEDDFNIPVPKKPKTKLGDLYELNNHRLLCGDSTNDTTVDLLMNNQIAHLLYTDPPYNINYAEFNINRGKKEQRKGKDWTKDYCSEWKDSMSEPDYYKFLYNFIRLAKKHLIPYGHYYIWHATTYLSDLIKALKENDIPYDKIPIIWVKQTAPLSWANYKRKYEPCIFAGKGAVNRNGKEARWFGPNNESTVWEISIDHNCNYIHPTQKPVALAARAITNSSQENENVLDLFMGSGTTIIACDMLNRKAFGMEMEPKFCDVIVLRYCKYKLESNQEFTIKKNGKDITIEIIKYLKIMENEKVQNMVMPDFDQEEDLILN